jgi:cell division protein FtsN
MSIIEVPKQENPPAESEQPKSADSRAKRMFIAFAATTTIGLGLAGWYVGGRVFAAQKAVAAKSPVAAVGSEKPAEPAPVPKATPAKPAEAPAAATEPKTEPQGPAVPTPEAAAPQPNRITPQEGEIYLQLAAMGPRTTDEYLKVLDGQGIHPKIAPGPTEGLYRILIGPIADKAVLEKQQQELQAAGIESIVRAY